MSLDIYVMPFRKFKSGDFDSPLQRVFGRDNVRQVSPVGVHSPPGNGTIGDSLVTLIANDEMTLLQAFLQQEAAEAGLKLETDLWTDEGDVEFAEQATVLEAASTYTLWLSHRDRFPRFEVPGKSKFAAHPVWEVHEESDAPPQFPQLVLHDMYVGYYLPCDFPYVWNMPTGIDWPTVRSIGSSKRLQQELVEVGKTLHLTWEEGLGLVDDGGERGEPLDLVVAALIQLSVAAELSCKHRLPIIFDG